MIDQGEFAFLGDGKDGERLRDLGIDRNWLRNAGWIEAGMAIARELCKRHPYFTTDVVWHYMALAGKEMVPEPRAMGAVMSGLKKQGVCRATDRTVKSKRSECHARPVRVWKSRVYGRK